MSLHIIEVIYTSYLYCVCVSRYFVTALKYCNLEQFSNNKGMYASTTPYASTAFIEEALLLASRKTHT